MSTEERLDEATKIIDYGLFLRMYGERPPGGQETWQQFDQMAEHFLREGHDLARQDEEVTEDELAAVLAEESPIGMAAPGLRSKYHSLPLMGIPLPKPGDLVRPFVHVRDRALLYYDSYMKSQREIEDTLAPALGYPAYQPGEPGYSEDQVNYVTGDHTAESLAFEAADRIEQLREQLGECEERHVVFIQSLAHLLSSLEADTISREHFFDLASRLIQERS